MHLVVGDAAVRLQPVEHRGPLPAPGLEAGGEAVAEDARKIAGDAAAGDVRHALDGDLLAQRQQRFYVDGGRRHQGAAECAALEGAVEVGTAVADDAADQRVAVGMRPTRADADHHVAGADAAPVEDLAFFHHAHGEAGEVVFAVGVHARHLGCLSTDECTAGLFAASGNAAHHCCGHIHVQLAAGEVVEKEQRFGALHQDVVDRHCHQIDAHRVVCAQLEGQLELGANTVSTRDQYGLAVLGRQTAQRAEATDAGHHLRPQGAFGQRLDALDEFIASVDVDAGVAVGEGGGHGRLRLRAE